MVKLTPLKDYRFEILESFVKCGVKIPKGFITNGVSSPRIFWHIVPPNRSDYLEAVILHDYLCEKAKTYADYKFADMKLNEALKSDKISIILRILIVQGCRLYHKIRYGLI